MEETRPLIDCDLRPFIPEGWEILKHQKGGQLEWDPRKCFLRFSRKQNGGGSINGHELYLELTDKPVLNACVLDYLYEHPILIPKDYKGDYIFFWGTIYLVTGVGQCVRYLYWSGDRWLWNKKWLTGDWNDHCPAILLKS